MYDIPHSGQVPYWSSKRQLMLHNIVWCERVYKYLSRNGKISLSILKKCVEKRLSKNQIKIARKQVLCGMVTICNGQESLRRTDNADYIIELTCDFRTWVSFRAKGLLIEKSNHPQQELEFSVKLVEDIYGKKDIFISPSKEMIGLAQEIYETEDFSLMKVLKDMLTDSSENQSLINHCDNELHVRGCWLLDLILGKG